ncbi:hypothetical protein MLD38_036177 [Melastoma candidum]|uniref:Uncharacterized protein n=1 Tax=Melastoma candidum TaxID=119954 RepID=A0ACB9LJ31_9MYRT|nr:hypothetical protein MLD38_036177 [Melastoma candidum]
MFAARISGSNALDELDVSTTEDIGVVSRKLTQIKFWFLSHAQHLNFITVLLLASVPNPLFDLAGIMCGQFGVPFWEFFLATLVGKAIIKTPIQGEVHDCTVSNTLRGKCEEIEPFVCLDLNSIVWLVLVNFFIKIVTATAQGYLKKQQD